MPKLKTHSGAKKRFTLTGKGKIKRRAARRNHCLDRSKKSPDTKRALRAAKYVDASNAPAVSRLLIKRKR